MSSVAAAAAGEHWLVGWLVAFYGMSTHWVILCRICFYLRTHIFFMNTIFLQTQFFYELMFWSI